MQEIKVRLTFTEEILGTAAAERTDTAGRARGVSQQREHPGGGVDRIYGAVLN